MDNDKLKQSSRINFLKAMMNNLWPTKLWRKAMILATMVDACLFQLAGRPKIAALNLSALKINPTGKVKNITVIRNLIKLIWRWPERINYSILKKMH
jgi:hypothetical protein